MARCALNWNCAEGFRIRGNEALIAQRDELRALALSLADALSDAVPVLEHAGRTYFDAMWRLTKARAALSSPSLLKLKGEV